MTAHVLELPPFTAYARHRREPQARAVVRRGLSALASVALLAAVVGFAALAIGPHVLGYRTAVMLTGSMTGTIDPGDLVVSEPIPADEVEVGDILTFRAPVADQHVETHRVIAVKHHADGSVMVRTQGDANPGPDPWRATITDSTVWKTEHVVPMVGDVIRALRSPVVRYGASWVALGAALLLGLSLIWRSDKE
ncbi:signal peptidase I [Nocardioides mangrovi]|uniref:Signal peptidase I n=1 Tax=Nocardioides mangrovi TaxID=2874580 RepID=A0ABS7UBT6_9ACTN|nr:signal peptidase I [Nocardioides mangrovi]MBZ5738473.1 signal peptidase I [Nocardioides mangrovi]